MKLIRNLCIFFILIGVIVIIGVAVAGQKGMPINTLEQSVRDSISSSQNIFRDKEFGLTFRYPKEWKERFVSPDMIRFSQDGEDMTMTLVLTTRTDAETLPEFTEKNIQEIKESAASVGQTIDLGEARPSMLGSIPALRIDYHANQKGLPVDGVQIWAVKDKKEYILTFAARKDVFKTAVHIFDSVLQSLQIK